MNTPTRTAATSSTPTTLAIILCGMLSNAFLAVGCEQRPAPPTETPASTSRSTTSEAAPRLEFDEPVIDFGSVPDHETRTAEVVVRNAGGRPLTVQKVVPTCGCTTVGFKTPMTIPVGGQSTITLDFDPKGGGRQEKYVQVVSNDPRRPTSTVTIRANVIATLTAEPRFLALGRVTAGTPVLGSIEVTAAEDGCSLKGAKITGDLAPYATPSITRVNDPAEARGVWRVDVNIAPTVPWGWHNGSMIVEGTIDTAEGPKPIEMNFAINGSFEGSVIADETLLGLLTLRPGQPIDRETTLQRVDGRPLALLSTTIVDGEPGLEAVVEPLDPERTKWRLRLRGKAPTRLGSVRGTIVVTTDDPANPVVAIRYAGNVR
ncbi:MAG: DUF1573 domain-containing protein [Planctomycetia bacterium]|nr:DUF1573 domain-containing protein [Planctomycetia bacterium]